MNPPLPARLLLSVIAGEAEAELVAGDLHEEFLVLCSSRGRRAARRWYYSQSIRSVLPLCDLRMRRGEIAHVAAAAGFGVALPLLLLDRLWGFVYSLVPLKEGLDRAPVFLAINVILASALAALCGATARNSRRALAIAAATACAALFGVWGAAGSAPLLYCALVISCPPLSVLAAFRWRRKLS